MMFSPFPINNSLSINHNRLTIFQFGATLVAESEAVKEITKKTVSDSSVKTDIAKYYEKLLQR